MLSFRAAWKKHLAFSGLPGKQFMYFLELPGLRISQSPPGSIILQFQIPLRESSQGQSEAPNPHLWAIPESTLASNLILTQPFLLVVSFLFFVQGIFKKS